MGNAFEILPLNGNEWAWIISVFFFSFFTSTRSPRKVLPRKKKKTQISNYNCFNHKRCLISFDTSKWLPHSILAVPSGNPQRVLAVPAQSASFLWKNIPVKIFTIFSFRPNRCHMYCRPETSSNAMSYATRESPSLEDFFFFLLILFYYFIF